MLTVHFGPISRIVLDRPQRANAYTGAMLDQLGDAVARLAGAARVVIVEATGAGAFCAGADLDELRGALPEDAIDLKVQRVFTALARAPFVSIAAVHGAAVGGGFELALACDLRVVGPSATFWLPEPTRGLLPAGGGTTRLARLVGPSRAKAVILGGQRIDASMSVDWGLAAAVEPDARAAALTWAEDIVTRDPVALRIAKTILDADESASSLALERLGEAVLYARRT